MDYLEKIFNPHNEVVLECALDGLVEKVGGKEFMNVCMWEIHHERLCGWSVRAVPCRVWRPPELYLEVWNNPMIVP